MIYTSLEHLEIELETVREQLLDYDTNHVFASGFDTAVDVMTCVNSSTIWHKPNPNDMPEGRVLIFVPGEGIHIGWWGCSNWQVQGYGLILPKDVAAWAELPDAPEV